MQSLILLGMVPIAALTAKVVGGDNIRRTATFALVLTATAIIMHILGVPV